MTEKKTEISPEERLRRVKTANRKYKRAGKNMRPKSSSINSISIKAGRNRREIDDLKQKFAFLENEFIQLGIRLDQFESKKDVVVNIEEIELQDKEDNNDAKIPDTVKKGKEKVKAK